MRALLWEHERAMRKLKQLPNVLVPVSVAGATFLTRRELATRWRCSGETIKRRQRRGLLNPVYLSARKILYRVSEIEALEADGGAR
jgi:hypothetical protein